MDHCFRVVRINMQYRAQCYFCHIGTVGRTTRIQVIRGKTDLIINDYMYGPIGLITIQTCHLHYFIYNTLTCNSSIAMYYDRQYLGKIGPIMGVLFCPCDPVYQCTDRLQMGGVGSNVHSKLFSIFGFPLGSPAQMIFYIPVKNLLLIILPVKFTENILCLLTKNIGKYIKPSPM